MLCVLDGRREWLPIARCDGGRFLSVGDLLVRQIDQVFHRILD